MRYFVLFMVALLSTSSVYARLGDSYKGSTKRFGKALNYFKDKYAEVGLFEHKGFAIFVIYRNGRSIEESYVLLLPEVKTKLKTEKYFAGKIKLLNDPYNLEELSEKYRTMLRRANLRADWKLSDGNNANGIEKMSASNGKIAVSGNYSPERRVLVIKNENPPPGPKAPTKEIELTKELCLPLGSNFIDYMDKLGTPYSISAPEYCFFHKENQISLVSFQNEAMNQKITSGKVDPSIRDLLRGLDGGVSIDVQYYFVSRKVLDEYKKHLENAKTHINKYKDRDKLNKEEKMELLMNIYQTGTFKHHTESMPDNLISAFLTATADSNWQPIPLQKIGEVYFSTWKNGRRLYASYDIIYKLLIIKLGMQPEDYKPEEIKKFREKSQSEALKGF